MSFKIYTLGSYTIMGISGQVEMIHIFVWRVSQGYTHNIPNKHNKKCINSNLFACLTLLCSLTDAAPNHQTPNHLGGDRNKNKKSLYNLMGLC